jgi:hypothetical protein
MHIVRLRLLPHRPQQTGQFGQLGCLGVAYLAHALHEPIRAALSEDLRERAMARTFVEFCAFTSAEAELADAEALSKKAESSSSGSPEKAQSGGR